MEWTREAVKEEALSENFALQNANADCQQEMERASDPVDRILMPEFVSVFGMKEEESQYEDESNYVMAPKVEMKDEFTLERHNIAMGDEPRGYGEELLPGSYNAGLQFQQKYKDISCSYARKLQGRKSTPSETATDVSRKTYPNSDKLVYLLPFVGNQRTTSRIEENGNSAPDDRMASRETNAQRIGYSEYKVPSPKRKRGINTLLECGSDEVYHVVSESIKQGNAAEINEDRHFMLSLVQELKSISTDYKLDAKMEIISILKKYKCLTTQTDVPYYSPQFLPCGPTGCFSPDFENQQFSQ